MSPSFARLTLVISCACFAVASLINPDRVEATHARTQFEQPIATTVCDLVGRPQDFNGHIVRIQARYESDGIHLWTLTDSNCAGGVMPSGHFWDDEVSGEFFTALRSDGFRGTSSKEVTAVWTGTYHWEPQNTPGTGKVPRWLDVTKIENLSVTMQTQAAS